MRRLILFWCLFLFYACKSTPEKVKYRTYESIALLSIFPCDTCACVETQKEISSCGRCPLLVIDSFRQGATLIQLVRLSEEQVNKECRLSNIKCIVQENKDTLLDIYLDYNFSRNLLYDIDNKTIYYQPPHELLNPTDSFYIRCWKLGLIEEDVKAGGIIENQIPEGLSIVGGGCAFWEIFFRNHPRIRGSKK